MTLEAGRRLGLFEVVEPLGAGGMGEVYRARDTKLGREVAIKVLPEAFATHADRLARFEREARLLAALNHSGIAAIHGFEQSDGVHFLVLELIEGRTLAHRIDRGALPQREALEIARQIAEALEAAHEKGIVHRDLKPTNIKLTPGGKIKLLDFGLAKALDSAAPDANSHVATETGSPTREGVVLGTAPYMSPEQARGEAVDKRTDVWAFGCVLYEMMTGRRAFAGATTSDTIVSVLTGEPDWTLLPRGTSAAIRTLLRRCLTRDLAHRVHDVSDVRIEIEEAQAEPPGVRRPPGPRARAGWAVGLVMSGAVLGTLVAGSLQLRRHQPSSAAAWFAKRLEVSVAPAVGPRSGYLGDIAFSPDGKSFVHMAMDPAGRLWLRQLDQLVSTPIAGTEEGYAPTFSPDGRWLAFFDGARLKKVLLPGGDPVTLCDAPTGAGASWSKDDRILFAPRVVGGLWWVSAAGGKPELVTRPDRPEADGHRFPEILPGGKAALFSLVSASGRDADGAVAAVSFATGNVKTLVRGAAFGRYAPSGHLIYGRAGTVYAVPFDPGRLELTGQAGPVLQGVRMTGTGGASLAVSPTGMLVYAPGEGPAETELVWVDRTGRPTPIAVPRRPYTQPRLSPDGRKIAMTIEGQSEDVWVGDFEASTWTRLTFEGENGYPAWSPDGRRIAFSSNRDGVINLYWQLADGSAPAERLATSPDWQTPLCFAPDGAELLFLVDSAEGLGLSGLSLGPVRKPRAVLATHFHDLQARISPDGRWLAYASDETRRLEVYLRPYPAPGAKLAVSAEGGERPVWSHDGRDLFYISGSMMMAVRVHTQQRLSIDRPQALFDAKAYHKGYDVAPDGRFLMLRDVVGPESSGRFVVIPDWFDELSAKLSGSASGHAP